MIAILLDQGLAPRAAAVLRDRRIDFVHASEIGLGRPKTLRFSSRQECPVGYVSLSIRGIPRGAVVLYPAGYRVRHAVRQVRARGLPIFAAHLVIPVHESSLRVVTPRPHVQFEMCGQAVPVWAVYELERLSL